MQIQAQKKIQIGRRQCTIAKKTQRQARNKNTSKNKQTQTKPKATCKHDITTRLQIKNQCKKAQITQIFDTAQSQQ